MTAESQPAQPAQPLGPSQPARAEESRARSTIEFPYFDLSSALEIAQAVKQVGGTACDIKQLATKLNMAHDGGGFRSRLMATKTFGLIEYERGQVELTELGLRAVDTQYERAARVDAFLAVPLYKALFEKLNGQTLPPAAAVERMAEQLGVAPKQKDRARQAFMRSAKTAGLFELSSDRLTLPPAVSGAVASEPRAPRAEERTRNGGGDEPPPIGRLRFEVPIPGKPSAVVLVPDDLDADDWEMLSTMMTTYIGRWKKFSN
jgi:hypothetical protein